MAATSEVRVFPPQGIVYGGLLIDMMIYLSEQLLIQRIACRCLSEIVCVCVCVCVCVAVSYTHLTLPTKVRV